VDRRTFILRGLAAMPLLAGPPWTVPPRGRGGGRTPLALTTADKEAHVVAVSLASGAIVKRIGTAEDPRSIERHGAGPAVVAHTAEGRISLVDPSELAVRRVLGGFSQPRYTAIARGGDIAYVSDSGAGEVAIVDLARGRVVRRVAVGDLARHITRSPDGRQLWVALGSSAMEVVALDVSDARHPVVRRRIRPPFLAHDVAFSPSGRRVWVTAGRERRLAVYADTGHEPLRLLGADAAPQHVTFGPRFAYVASGDGATVRVHSLADGSVRRVARVPLGSYNVQRGGGHVVTPSLAVGHLTILDADGRVERSVKVASAAHDACVVE
jgi:DNA-binding beta-propeller fold protein YncE